MIMNIKLYPPLAIHEIGGRENQEDFIYPALNCASIEDSLYIVCDGMGGHEHGEVASSTFAKALAWFFEGRVSPDVVLTDQTLRDAIDYAYTQLDAVDDGNMKKMGTTLTMLYFHSGGVTAAHIGDSRIYHVRPGAGLLYVSRDHSLVFDLYQSGEITHEEMKTHTGKNVITRAVQPGVDNRVQPDIIHITDVQPGDWFCLCSDGILEQLDDEDLAALLLSNESDEKKRKLLIAATADNSDNHSAYLIHVDAVTYEVDNRISDINEEQTSRFNALNIKPVNAPISNEEDDVEMIPPPYHPREHTQTQNNNNNRKWLLLLLLIALVIGAGIWLISRNDKNNDGVEHSSCVDATNDSIVIHNSGSRIRPIQREHDSSQRKEVKITAPASPKALSPAVKQKSKDSSNSIPPKINPKILKNGIPNVTKKPMDNHKPIDEKTNQDT